MITIVFDVDGTLIDYMDRPRNEIINLLRSLQIALPQSKILIASGGGTSYARVIADRIGLSDVEVTDKYNLAHNKADIIFDDYSATHLAKVWIPV